MLIDFYEKQQPAPLSCGRLFFEYTAWCMARIYASGGERWEQLFEAFTSLLRADADDPLATATYRPDDFQSLLEHAMGQEGIHPDFRGTFSQLETEQTLSLGARQYLFTAGERLIIGALSSLPGDEIWVLGGCTVPVILRKVSSYDDRRYNFVGQAYVHGVMEGEAAIGVTDFQDILLC